MAPPAWSEYRGVVPISHRRTCKCPDALKVAQYILQAIRSLNIEHSEHPLGTVTASAGISTRQPSVENVTPATLLKSADAQLYLAKHSGRNCIR